MEHTENKILLNTNNNLFYSNYANAFSFRFILVLYLFLMFNRHVSLNSFRLRPLVIELFPLNVIKSEVTVESYFPVF